ncbi:hypothetical protein GUJ93_ZPchr0012g19246 [Zizania palustris]|uniref:RING-type E3 ubiquitin transferase n=1 Tax=Zizania palustris TaxID=103762 RepID=A0A8J6BT79_ZIZPA|nr:hypothetical protein GUJ93_ZPchr0012g19246 [Zizania palustris]
MPTPRRHHELPLALTALLLLLHAADAQPNESRDRSNGGGGVVHAGGMNTQEPSFSAPMVVLLVALIAAFFFIGFFSIYIRRCGRESSAGPVIPAAALLALSRQEQRNRQRGLDPAVVASFPTMKYAEARALRDAGKDAVLECAVCLSEFDDEEEFRLLPKCSHAFHPDCIGEWLAGHVTCPVCRCNLDPEDPAAAEANVSSEAAVEQQEVAIDMDREGEVYAERRREMMELERIGSQRRAVRSRSGRPLPRSHSTGHSLAPLLGGDLERFTLRLPEHVRREMVAATGESLRRTAGREGRGGSGARNARSDRWPSFIVRTFSSRVPFLATSRRVLDAEAGGADGSTTAPPASTARTKRDKTAASPDASVSSAKGSVRFDCISGVGAGAGGVPSTRIVAVAGDSDEEEKPITRHV